MATFPFILQCGAGMKRMPGGEATRTTESGGGGQEKSSMNPALATTLSADCANSAAMSSSVFCTQWLVKRLPICSTTVR